MTAISRRHLGALAFALALGTACGAPAEDPVLGSRAENLIGGVIADSPALDHTGAIVFDDLFFLSIVRQYQLCTATLIAPQVAVTAKQCVAELAEQIGSGVFGAYFNVGPDASAPAARIPIVAVATAPGDAGGFARYGRDVAVVFLDYPAPVEPAVIAPFDASFVGSTMITLGYGQHREGEAPDGPRRIGRETIEGVEGNTFEHMFGSFENYVEWLATGEVTEEDYLANGSTNPAYLSGLARTYASEILLEDHEAVTGWGPHDTPVCEGDFGGPLMRVGASGEWLTYGVASGRYEVGVKRNWCEYASVFATFGPVTFEFLQASLDWQDPCGDVPDSGVCDGAVLSRCETSIVGGIRRLLTTDCAAQGEACVTSSSGAACAAAP